MTVQLTVLGLGQIGVSVGLALAPEKQQLTRVGFDRSAEISRRAEKQAAFDQVRRNLHAAVESAQIVVLALPLDEIRDTLELIGPTLQPDTVVVDFSPLKQAVTAWAQELLPENVFFVSLTPTLNPYNLLDAGSGPEAAQSDLFKDSEFVLTCPPETPNDAIELAINLAILLGGRPMFTDPAEADGLSAAVVLLPKLAAAALANATIGQPGWLEARRLAGQAYAFATEPLNYLDEKEAFGQAALLNSANAVRVLDNLAAAIQELRDSIAAGDEAALHAQIERARSAHQGWWQQRKAADWDQVIEKPDIPSAGEQFMRMLGLRRKTKGRK